MADSENGSELSEISMERFRVLEDYYEANYQEPTTRSKLRDEFDDQGFYDEEIVVAICESKQEQECQGNDSTIFRSSELTSEEIESKADSQKGRKRKRSQANDDGTKKCRVPLGSLTSQDQRSEGGPLEVCSEFEVTEMSEHHSAKLIRPTGLQSVTQDMSKPITTTAQPPVANPSLSHDPEQIAYCNQGLIFEPSAIRIKSRKSPLRRIFEGCPQESDELQSSSNDINITSKDVDHSKETPLYSGPVESGTKADDISNSDELTLKQTKGRSKRPVKSTATKKAASHKADRLWEVDTVVTDSNSPLTNINLHAVLMKEEAWTSLSLEQQKKLISMLPNPPSIEPDESKRSFPNVLKAVLQTSAAMKADIRLFQEDLRAGRLEPEWQLMARRAMRRRANGDFDEFERKRREEIWGIAEGEIELDCQQSKREMTKRKSEPENG